MLTADLSSDDLYTRLGVAKDAGPEDVKRAYKQLVRQYTPERAPDDFVRVREAYEILSNAASRKEYDERLPPAIVDILKQASVAERRNDYAEAERLFKQALVERSDLVFARNRLGISLLHQSRPDEALQQFKRLAAEGHTASYVFGNMAYAHIALHDKSEAERLFRRAIAAGRTEDVDVNGFILQIADLMIEAERFADAEAELEAAILSDGVVDILDLAFFVKLVDVHVHQRSVDGLKKALARVIQTATNEEERQFVALKLAGRAQAMTRAYLLEYAGLTVGTARTLQPADEDYKSFEELLLSMRDGRAEALERLIGASAPLQGGGWLHSLGQHSLEYLDSQQLMSNLSKVNGSPALYSVNGFGLRMFGKRDKHQRSGTYVTLRVISALFIPIFPVDAYRVRDGDSGGWRIMGKVPLTQKEQLWRVAAITIGLVLFLMSRADG